MSIFRRGFRFMAGWNRTVSIKKLFYRKVNRKLAHLRQTDKFVLLGAIKSCPLAPGADK